MNSIQFLKAEVAAAVARGVHQFVMIGSHPALGEAFKLGPGETLPVFALNEEQTNDSPDTAVQTHFASEALSAALEKSHFDQMKATLFFWLGGAGYRAADAALASLAFIASLPRGSGVVFDYAVERTALGSIAHTALDALASRIAGDSTGVRYLIQPQAVSIMLRGLGFQKIVDRPQDDLHVTGGHLVSAVV